MDSKKSIRLPFFLIAIFSVVIMAAIFFTQYQTNNSVRQLKNGNALAVQAFQARNLIDGIINNIYITDSKAASFSSNATTAAKNISDTLLLIQQDVAKVQQLAASVATKALANELAAMIARKLIPLQQLLNNATLAAPSFSIEKSKELTDSIYVTGLELQQELQASLQNAVVENEKTAQDVFTLARVIGFLSIGAVAILATIIIRRMLHSHRLIGALDDARLQTEKAAQVKQQFLANMSHEIRTPVNSVIGFTKLLQKTKMKEDQQQFVGLIKTAGESLLSIINDILDISKIEAGMLHFDKNPFSLRELCYGAEMMFYHRITEKNLYFESIINDDVPEVIIGDRERLNQVLVNLVNNAIKFTKDGGITLKVEKVQEVNNEAVIRFTVTDTGIGIMPDKLDKIFDRFEQAETDTTRKYGGTGLGLSIVKDLITIQGGAITAKSEPGMGSSFIFELSFTIGELDLQEKVKDQNRKPFAAAVVNKLKPGIKILAAEDNKMNQMLLTYMLKQWHLNYELAETGRDAIAALQQNEYDIVLMDIQMPIMDGYTAAKKVRNELKSNVPIIAMTANVLPGEKEKCLQSGMNDYIAKPINEELMYAILLKYMPQEISPNNADADTKMPEGPFIDIEYLNQFLGGNQVFIKDIVQQFIVQYPAELKVLHDVVSAKDYNKVKAQSHHMKTTVATINKNSPLLPHLEYMESAVNDTASWEIIQFKLNWLLQTKDQVMAEALKISEG
jgi:signal transduction histidine kinase/CheY-like chemotaxis protein